MYITLLYYIYSLLVCVSLKKNILFKSFYIFHSNYIFMIIFKTAERLNDVKQIKKEHPNKIPVSENDIVSE